LKKTINSLLTPADDLVFKRAVNAPTILVERMTIAGR